MNLDDMAPSPSLIASTTGKSRGFVLTGNQPRKKA